VDVTGSLERCSFEFDPKAWDREHDRECFVDPYVDDEILTESADGDTVWRCPHEVTDGEAKCVFHLPLDSSAKPDAEKVADAFLEIVNGERETVNSEPPRPVEFVGAEFESLDLDTEQIGDGRPIDLRHAKIGGADWEVGTVNAEPLDARGLTVRGEWDNNGVTFGGDARFDGGEFGGEAGFRSAEFGGEAGFRSAEFGGYAGFRSAEFGKDVFGSDADFVRAEFGKNVEFVRAEFGGDAMFDGAEFGGYAEFSGVEFGGDAGFSSAEFGEYAGFGWAEFGGVAGFSSAEFGRDARFVRAKFDKVTGFVKAEFGGDARFSNAEFGDNATFTRAEFGGDATFNGTEFGGDAAFTKAEFKEGATFTVDGWFPISQFQGNAEFRDVTADGPLQFEDEYDSLPGRPYTFLGEVDFDRANIPNAKFSGVSFREAPTFKGSNLTRIDLSESDLSGAVFNDALLSQASLYGTDLTNARLYGARMDGAHVSDHTDFGVRNQGGTTRAFLLPWRGPRPDVRYDERNPEYDRFANPESGEDMGGGETISDYTRAAAVYAEIERVAQENADSELASRSYLWRKDMQRRRYRSDEGRGNTRELGRWMWSWFANVFVRYGESPWRVTSIAGLVIAVCAILYHILDLIEYSTSPSQSALLAAVDGTPPSPVVTFLDAVYFSTLTFSTLGMGTFQPSGPLGRAIAIFETLSGVVLLALLVFVFGRRATR